MEEKTNNPQEKISSEIQSPEAAPTFENKEKESAPEPEAPFESAAPSEKISETPAKISTVKKIPPLPQTRDALSVKVEKILEEGLSDAYSKLSPVAKQEFKIKGEKTAFAIRDILNSAHIQVKKIFNLILNWLKIMPGVNRFFLEQEAKVKTDKIILLKQNNLK